jgi:hypothetical protein
MECSSSQADIDLAAQDIADSILSAMCSRLDCESDGKVVVTNICGQGSNTEAANWSSIRRQLVSSTEEVYFTFIISALADSELRVKETLIGQYLQGSNLVSILTDIRNSIVSSTTAVTLRSITAINYSFVDSFIRGLGLYYPDWGTSNTCLNDGNQEGEWSKGILLKHTENFMISFSLSVLFEDYMNNHPDQWMFANLDDCCNRYFPWDVIGCLGSDPSFVDPTKALYYPDWGKSSTCINDGNAPAYMKRAPNVWMHGKLNGSMTCLYRWYYSEDQTLFIPHLTASLVDCCKRYYTWEDDFKKCILSGGGSTPTQSPKTDAWCKFGLIFSVVLKTFRGSLILLCDMVFVPPSL